MAIDDQRTLLSVIVVSWNTRALLGRCLASVQAEVEALKRPVEVFVVDNASADLSAELVLSEFPWVHLIQNSVNAGFASANNQALRLSHGDYVMLLNPDTEVKEGAFARLLSFLDRRPEVGAVGPRLIHADGSLQQSCYPLPTLAREFWRLLHLDKIRPWATYPAASWDMNQPREVESLQGACLLIRQSVLNQVGHLDERFFVYTEEIDLCRRILENGSKLFWIPDSVIVHHEGQSTDQTSYPMFLQLYRSKLDYFRKHEGRVAAFVYKVILLLATIPRLVLSAMMMVFPPRRRQMRTVLKHYGALLFELPTL